MVLMSTLTPKQVTSVQASRKKYRDKPENKEKMKQYYVDHREKIMAIQNEYRLTHVRPSITCECGCEVQKRGMSPHLLTQKHIQKMMMR